MPNPQLYTAAEMESLRQRARNAVTAKRRAPVSVRFRGFLSALAGSPREVRQAHDAEGCWAVSKNDPGAMITAFDRLHLEPGLKLCGYCYESSLGGNCFVYALPRKAKLSDPKLFPRNTAHYLRPPRPPGALDDVMSAIGGDGSACSYLQASVLARELREFGAQWHGLDWTTHSVLDRPPANSGLLNRSVRARPSETAWIWLEPVSEWRPSVSINEADVFVVFYTYSELYQRRIVRHTDVYRPGGYCFGSVESVVADGGGGYCF